MSLMLKTNEVTRALFITARANTISVEDFAAWEEELEALKPIVQLFLDPPEAK